MADKKDKYLESAQRFVLKGQLDKAIRDYEQIVALEPKEIRYRQKLAELLVRDNRKDEAIVQYEDIGKHYAENSYFLKAIAVYKQIQRLSPGDTAISLTLASLNHRQGLIGNALAEYGLVVAQFEKEGLLQEAAKVLEQMLGVDGEHAATRLNYAEILLALGDRDASYRAFSALLGALRAGGDGAAIQNVSERMRQLFPGHQEYDLDQRSARLPAGLDTAIASSLPADVVVDPRVNDGSVYQATGALDRPNALKGAGEQPTLRQVARDPDACTPSVTAIETPSAFEPASAAPETAAVTAVPGAFETPWGSEAPGETYASKESAAPGLSSPWEEEIELDLDDDLHDTVIAAAPDADLSLDFSLSLDFDEGDRFAQAPLDGDQLSSTSLSPKPSAFAALPALVGTSPLARASVANDPSCVSESSAPGEKVPQKMAALDLEEEGLLELTLPEASEISQEVEWAEEAEQAGSGAAGSVTQPLRCWQEIYPETGSPADAVIDFHELESHYDLGLGYKEMGLYNEAIKEFAVAAGNPKRRLDCLTLQAICYREKGEPAKAEDLLQRGRALEVLSVEERMSLSYELAFLFETTGAVDEAIRLYREVHEVNPGFHDVVSKLSTLTGEEPLDIIELELEEDDF